METTYGEDAVTIMVMLIVVAIAIILVLIPTIFYLISMQKTLGCCREENQVMKPGLVWLMIIPLFGMIWQFFVVIQISDSLKKEFASLGEDLGDENPGKGIGLAYCITGVASNIPYIGIIPGIASLVCWIMHWVKIVDYRHRIEVLQSEQPIRLS